MIVINNVIKLIKLKYYYSNDCAITFLKKSDKPDKSVFIRKIIRKYWKPKKLYLILNTNDN